MYKLSIKFFLSKNINIWILSKLDKYERSILSNLKEKKKIKLITFAYSESKLT